MIANRRNKKCITFHLFSRKGGLREEALKKWQKQGMEGKGEAESLDSCFPLLRFR